MATTKWDSILKKEQAAQKDKLDGLLWFHPNINRTTAETKIKNAGIKKNGTFLVRESCGQLKLSFSYEKKVAHYKITERRHLNYCIENGDTFKGLENLIQHYRHERGNLPIKLLKPVKGEVPPPLTVKQGFTNSLHKAINDKKEQSIVEILESKRCPNLDNRNDKGSTALHLAAKQGLVKVLELLIKKGATVMVEDSEGYTPLHKGSMQNNPQVIQVLVEKGGAEVHYRRPQDGNMALHEAAQRGHLESVKELFRQGACPWPRNSDEKTPYEFAKQLQQEACASYIDSYVPPAAITKKVDWYHENIDRRGALHALEKKGMKEGLFLVRKSMRQENGFVLTYLYGGQGRHVEIEVRGKNNAFYINNGNLFFSLEQLIEYYCVNKDGLHCTLKLAISPNGAVNPMLLTKKLEKTYFEQNLVPVISESGFTEYSLASNVARHGSISSTSSGDYQVPEARPQSAFTRELEGHILKKESINMGYELGQGEFGSVLKGTWTNNKKTMDVAIKTLHEEHLSSGSAIFLKEAEIMVKLAHPCIVKLIGVSEGPPLMLVQELVQLGSLLDFLLDYPEKIDPKQDLFLWAAQIASGMLYLEKEGFVHRDLAARNILVQAKNQVKVGDFGLSRAVGTDQNCYTASKGGRWPVRWYAPESINYGKFSHASDVWSFGVTLWEMFTFGEQPYENMSGADVTKYVENKGRLKQPDRAPKKVYEVMRQCWQYEPEERISFKKLLAFFNEMSGESYV